MCYYENERKITFFEEKCITTWIGAVHASSANESAETELALLFIMVEKIVGTVN